MKVDKEIMQFLKKLGELMGSEYNIELNKNATDFSYTPSYPSSIYNGFKGRREREVKQKTNTLNEVLRKYIESFGQEELNGIIDIYEDLLKIKENEKAKELLEKYRRPYKVYKYMSEFVENFNDFGVEVEFHIVPYDSNDFIYWESEFKRYMIQKSEELNRRMSSKLYLEIKGFVESNVLSIKDSTEVSKFNEVYLQIIPFKEIIEKIESNGKIYDRFFGVVRQNFDIKIKSWLSDEDSLLSDPTKLTSVFQSIQHYVANSKKYPIYSIAELDSLLEENIGQFKEFIDEKIREFPFEVHTSQYESYIEMYRKLSNLLKDESFTSLVSKLLNLDSIKLLDEDTIKKIKINKILRDFDYLYKIEKILDAKYAKFKESFSLADDSELFELVEFYKEVQEILNANKNTISSYMLRKIDGKMKFFEEEISQFFNNYIVEGVSIETPSPYDHEVSRIKEELDVFNEGLENIILAIKSIDKLEDTKRKELLSILGYKQYDVRVQSNISIYPPTKILENLVSSAKKSREEYLSDIRRNGFDLSIAEKIADKFVDATTLKVNEALSKIGIPFVFENSAAQDMYYNIVFGMRSVDLTSFDDYEREILGGVLCAVNGRDPRNLKSNLSKAAAYTFLFIHDNLDKEQILEAAYYIFSNFDILVEPYKLKARNYFSNFFASKENIIAFDNYLRKYNKSWDDVELIIPIVQSNAVRYVVEGDYTFCDLNSRKMLQIIHH